MTDVSPPDALQAVLPAGAPEPCSEGDSARAYRSGHLIALHAKTPMPAAASTP